VKALTAKVTQLDELNGTTGGGGQIQTVISRSATASSSASGVFADARDVAVLERRHEELVRRLAEQGVLETPSSISNVESHDQSSSAHESLFGDRNQ
jgi:hypothetical protein